MIELPNEYGIEASDLVSSSGTLVHILSERVNPLS